MSKWGPVALSKRAVPGLFCYHFTYCFSIWKTCAHMYVTKKWTHSHDIVKPSIHGFRSYHIYYSKWRICCWQCFQKFHVRSPPFAETSLLLRATRQLILGSGFFNQSFQIKKGKNIIIKWSGSTYFSNKDVPDISAWMCFMTWKLIWNPSSFKTCQKKWCQDIYCNGQLQPFTFTPPENAPLPRYLGYEHIWRNGSEVPLYINCVKLGACTQYGWWFRHLV